MKFGNLRGSRPMAPAQRGVVLVVALIMLVAMTLAGIALVRSMDTANLIAGNFGFRQGAVQASDAGVEAALAALPNIVATSLDTNIANRYYATMQALDARGVPAGVDFDSAYSTAVGAYTANYVIERLCTGALPVTNIQGSCISDPPASGGGGGSNKAGSAQFTSSTLVYYRVTIRVTGPRATVVFVQAILGQ